jgi:hypothetical protein
MHNVKAHKIKRKEKLTDEENCDKYLRLGGNTGEEVT